MAGTSEDMRYITTNLRCAVHGGEGPSEREADVDRLADAELPARLERPIERRTVSSVIRQRLLEAIRSGDAARAEAEAMEREEAGGWGQESWRSDRGLF